MIGGGNSLTDLFRVKVNTGGTDYEILQGLTGNTVATARANKALSLIELEDTKPSFQEDGTVQISFDQHQDDQDLLDFLDAVNPPIVGASGGIAEKTLENGVKIGGGSSSSDSLVLLISYGAYSADGTKLKVLVSLGHVKRTSGSYSQKYGDSSKPSFEFVGIKAQFDLEIAAGIFHSGAGGLVDATAIATELPKLAKDAGFARKFCTKHA